MSTELTASFASGNWQATLVDEELYCPRCDAVTSWTNEDDGGLETRCDGCGLARSSELTREEHERALRRYERMTSIFERPKRKTWRWT